MATLVLVCEAQSAMRLPGRKVGRSRTVRR